MGHNNNENQRIEHNGTINLLRLCTVFLAAVSFWATAQGMKEYVFEEEWQAYAASMAIQGILLGLNFYLPVFLKLADELWKKGILIVLTGIILFCSSWFSYVYIAGKVYNQSWQIESRLLVEQTYRQELFKGNEYGEAYQQDLEEALGQQVVSLYNHTRSYEGLADTNTEIQIDWQEEREKYTGENFAAKSGMETIIDTVEEALDKVNNANIQERAKSNVSSMKTTMENRYTSLNDDIVRIKQDIEGIQEEVEYDEVEPGEEMDNVGLLRQQERDLINRREELWNQQKDYQDALKRVSEYEIYLQMVGNNSAGMVKDGLQSIQSELFKEEPDIATALAQATELFEVLLRNQDLGDDQDTDYMILLNEVNAFIQNLNKYQLVKGINNNFQDCIIKLRDEQIEGTGWKQKWQTRLNNLKSLISTLPNYNGEKKGVLRDYDHTGSSNSLDDIIRSYISDHNATQQGIIYLKSPYRGLAVFSLILAFFFDLAGFATGVLIQIQEEKGEKEPMNFLKKRDEIVANQDNGREERENEDQQLWTTLSMLNQYVYFTGDFTFIDGKYSYIIFKNGEKEQVVPANKNIVTSGLYIEYGEKYTPIALQTLSFAATKEGARDGVYKDSVLNYEDSMVTIASGKEIEDDEYHFLANVDENVPVYRVNGAAFEIFPAKQLKKTNDARIVVVALNKKGTLVAAIYII